MIHDADDRYISGLIAMARAHMLSAYRLVLFTTQMETEGVLEAENFLPVRPIISVDEVLVDGLAVASANYELDSISKIPRLLFRSRSGSTATIRFTAGFGDDLEDVPPEIRGAMLLLIAHWYENRMAVVVGKTVAEVPHTVDALMMREGLQAGELV